MLLSYRLEEMQEYCEDLVNCRRKTFSAKFGEVDSSEWMGGGFVRCGNMCDNCLCRGGAPRRESSGTKAPHGAVGARKGTGTELGDRGEEDGAGPEVEVEAGLVAGAGGSGRARGVFKSAKVVLQEQQQEQRVEHGTKHRILPPPRSALSARPEQPPGGGLYTRGTWINAAGGRPSSY